MASINIELNLIVLTPVHVGGSDDKHLVEGFDYLIEGKQVFIFDQKKLRKVIANDSQYINAMSEGKTGIGNLLRARRISLNDISYPPKRMTGAASEIKTCIKNGMNGKPYLPGSSIKGALRSMIFSHIYKKLPPQSKSKFKNERNLEDKLLGVFQNSLMRFIQVSDVYFDDVETEIHNAKIFNLFNYSNNWEGGWKHQLDNKTTEDFSSEGFTFAYECIPPNSVGKLRVSFDEVMYEIANKSTELNITSFVKELFSKNFKEKLFEIIQYSTESYLKKELEFFEKYNTKHTVSITSSIQGVVKRNKPNVPVFRMASGSGFHSITGDWQYETSHVVSKVWGNPFDKMRDGITPNPDFDKDYQKYGVPFRRRRKLEGGLMWKSRRLLFEELDESYSFTPMGFVQIYTPEYYENHLKRKIEALNEKAKVKLIADEKARKEKQEAEILAAEEAQKPVWRTIFEVKKEGVLDGEVVGQQGLNVEIKPFVQGISNENILVRYAAGFPIGTIIQLSCQISKKGKILIYGYPKVKN